MKKYLFVFTMVLGLGFLFNIAAAQSVANTISVGNQTGCDLFVQPASLDPGCSVSCQVNGVNIPAHGHFTFNWPCPAIDANASGFFTMIKIIDPGSGTGIKIGNGCNLALTGTFVDCQGITRTATFTPPSLVMIQ